MLLNNNFPSLIEGEVNWLLSDFRSSETFKRSEPVLNEYQQYYWDVLKQLRDFLKLSTQNPTLKTKTIDELNDLFVEQSLEWDKEKIPQLF